MVEARVADAYVLGDGLPALAAALELAEVGLSVRVGVPDREDRPDAWTGPDDRGVPDPDGALRDFLEHVAAPLTAGGPAAEAARPVAEPPAPVLLRGPRGEWAPQPTPAVLGIPAVPVSSSAVALLGGRAAARAYLDRVKPVLTIGKTHALGALVRARLGSVPLERLVEPLVRERFGVSADEVEVAIAAPGLNETLTRTGSLSGAALAYADRVVARETGVAPSGGWAALRRALLERLALYGAEFADAAVPASAPRRGGEGAAGEWLVREDGGEVGARSLVIGLEGAAGGCPSDPAGESDELRPSQLRVRGGAPVEDPGLPVGDRGVMPAVQTVTIPGGERWSLRIERDGAGYRVEAAGPAIPAVDAGGWGRDEPASRVREALAAADLRPRSGETAAAVRAAPYASIAQRDAAVERLGRARDERRDTLPVGTALHGGDLATAVADARAAAVVLRRRLTGISE
ncbi:hypothetical protein [Leucobacter sp. wl10]|uniref:hypothetical protein n=1 Tax=Leucobacter sp. wl10 TaxID=2304677 RepID=UPI0013C33322|nr:hypothetical protein [Leucobacter sp. wl10]